MKQLSQFSTIAHYEMKKKNPSRKTKETMSLKTIARDSTDAINKVVKLFK